jgi:hypothetical protein
MKGLETKPLIGKKWPAVLTKAPTPESTTTASVCIGVVVIFHLLLVEVFWFARIHYNTGSYVLTLVPILALIAYIFVFACIGLFKMTKAANNDPLRNLAYLDQSAHLLNVIYGATLTGASVIIGLIALMKGWDHGLTKSLAPIAILQLFAIIYTVFRSWD